jgi:Zn-dependent protease with chaperone function
MENRKISALLAEQAEQEVEKEVVPPSVEEQKAMWSNNGAAPINPLSQPNTNDQFGFSVSEFFSPPPPPPSRIQTISN